MASVLISHPEPSVKKRYNFRNSFISCYLKYVGVSDNLHTDPHLYFIMTFFTLLWSTQRLALRRFRSLHTPIPCFSLDNKMDIWLTIKNLLSVSKPKNLSTEYWIIRVFQLQSFHFQMSTSECFMLKQPSHEIERDWSSWNTGWKKQACLSVAGTVWLENLALSENSFITGVCYSSTFISTLPNITGD